METYINIFKKNKNNMKLKRFLLRYYPPGIILEYTRSNGEQETKSIDLLNLSSEYDLFWSIRTDVD